MKLVNLVVILALLGLCSLIGYELWTGQAIRNPGPYVDRATQPSAYWWYVGIKIMFVAIGGFMLLADRKKNHD